MEVCPGESFMYKLLKKTLRLTLKLVEGFIAISGNMLSASGNRRVQIAPSFKIALLINFGIGNVLMVSPMLKAIKNKYPDSEITVIGEKSSLQIIKYNPYWDKCFYISRSMLQNISLFSRLDCDVFMCAFPSNSFRTSVFGLLSSAPIRIGYEYPTLFGYSSLFFTHHLPRINEHIVTKNIALLKLLDIRVDVEDQIPKYYFKTNDSTDFLEMFFKKKNIFSKKIVAFHVGASIGGIGRRWSLAKFDELALLLEEIGYTVLLLVGPDETTLIPHIEAFSSECVIVNGLNLDQVSCVLAECAFIISNDSALMHIAAAVSTPSVGIYGPTDPALSSPYGIQHEPVRAHIECSPCYRSENPLSCKIGYKCMETISVQNVFTAITKLQEIIANS